VRLSRPCYDKMHRCPGWAGGGMRFAQVYRCEDGRLRRHGTLEGIYEGRYWWLRFNRCDSCDVLVLPFAVRYLDWRHWQYELRDLVRYTIPNWYRDWADDRRWRRDQRRD
jgi:protein involved in temperature-dependent protein secretion